MASFYLPVSSRALAEAIARESEAKIIERPVQANVEIHGTRLIVTKEMILGEDPGLPQAFRSKMLKATWDSLKGNFSTGQIGPFLDRRASSSRLSRIQPFRVEATFIGSVIAASSSAFGLGLPLFGCAENQVQVILRPPMRA